LIEQGEASRRCVTDPIYQPCVLLQTRAHGVRQHGIVLD
jgi:hypothetical protein